AIAAAALAYYGVRMRFVEPAYISLILSFVWVIGVCNALNIIDIMDGLSASQAAIGSLGFLLVALPSEMVYVNFAAAALMGATLGFLPHNFSQRRKIFMGDSGSLFLGFIMAALAMGARYDHKNPLGVYAPLLILAVPIYDTFFVAIMRIARGESPFQGSKDHFALRLEKAGLSRRKIVALSALVSLVLTACAALVTKLPLSQAAWIYAFAAGGFFILSLSIAKIKMHDES
ncbi:MAG: MraY family glycosyltransferase, partial [Elusimicrobia bacterium]|nr:MraY family glycosyltransferase [Elusimicrobiota bacterium]